MRRKAIATLSLLTALLLPAPGRAAAGAADARAETGTDSATIVGRVAAVDVAHRTLRFTKDVFHVPPEVPGFHRLRIGAVVTLDYSIEGTRRTVSRIRLGDH